MWINTRRRGTGDELVGTGVDTGGFVDPLGEDVVGLAVGEEPPHGAQTNNVTTREPTTIRASVTMSVRCGGGVRNSPAGARPESRSMPVSWPRRTRC